jgi:hypothetical protein
LGAKFLARQEIDDDSFMMTGAAVPIQDLQAIQQLEAFFVNQPSP